jgi:hypothetical protein
MQAVDQLELPGTRVIIFAKDQPPYTPLPALVYEDGKVLTEWAFSEEERAAVAKGENLRLWIWTFGSPLQPVALEITDEHKG